jgi:hypothetical protein
MRQGAAIRKQYQPRPQCQQAALERQSASYSRQGEGRYQTYPRLHFLPSKRKSRESLKPLTTKETKVHERSFTDSNSFVTAKESLYCTPSNSTSKISVALGGITPG